jgi:hypothetical protein
MLTAEALLAASSKARAAETWPGIVDLDVAQSDPRSPFWDRFRPEELGPVETLRRCRSSGDWTLFWSRIDSAGRITLYLGGSADDTGASMTNLKQDPVPSAPPKVWSFASPDDAVEAVFRAVVSGRLDSDEPDLMKKTEHGMIFYWCAKPI